MANRIPVGAPGTVSTTFYAPGTETPTDPDSQACTVGVVHANGAVVVPPGTAATHGTMGTFTFVLPPQPQVADLIVTWTALFGGVATNVTDYVQVVGGFFATLAEIRALDGLSNSTTFPTQQLIDKREAAEVLFEQSTGRHWTRKYQRDVLDGDPRYRRGMMVTDNFYFIQTTRRLALTQVHPRVVLWAGIDNLAGRIVTDGVTNGTTTITSATAAFNSGTDIGMLVTGAGIPMYATIQSVQSATSATLSVPATLSATSVTLNLGGGEYSNGLIYTGDVPLGYKLYPGGEVERALSSSGWPRGVENIVLEYTYGEDQPPGDLKDQFLVYVRSLLLSKDSRIPSQATSMQTDFGSFQLGQARGWDKPTGIASVDAVLERYGEKLPVIA